MVLEKWVADTERLATNLPHDNSARQRMEMLAHDIAPHAVPIQPAFFLQDEENSYAPGTFFTVDRNALRDPGTLEGIRKHALGPALAFVLHAIDESPSVLAIPPYNPDSPVGNALVLTHELEHIAQKQAGLVKSRVEMSEIELHTDIGRIERPAYRLNIDALLAADGSDFERYLSNWPVDFSDEHIGLYRATEVTFHDNACPIPPKETLAYTLWQESDSSRQLLQSIGRVAVTERVSTGLPEEFIHRLVGSNQL